FAVLIHRAVRDLGAASFVEEWVSPRQRVPVFDVGGLREFSADPFRRFFLAELLASYTHVTSGSVLVQTSRGWRRRRFSEHGPPGIELRDRSLPLSPAPALVWGRVMASWAEFAAAEPAFAREVAQRFAIRKHKTLATLRKDGAPRISGIEVEFGDGEVYLGMMPASRKLDDLQRDPRLALHSPTDDPPEGHPGSWPGEAKIS